MNTTVVKTAVYSLCALASAALALPQLSQAAEAISMVKAGIITDIHHTSKADSATRKYSASLDKLQVFMDTMARERPIFVIELGDMVDTLAEGTDPAKNLAEAEKIFTSFNGPAYHVLGNHEFDNLTREVFLNAITNTGIAKGQTYYSWDAGGVHFIVLDADYTPQPPHRPYDMNTPEDTFWTWKDTFVPQQELTWLREDLKKADMPTVVFTHQNMDRVDDQEHNIKNASEVRKILEEDGQVLAVISGHDHQGGYSNIKGIHYIVLHGNVGVNDYRTWAATSNTEGFDKNEDNQFALLEISKGEGREYRINVQGYGRQPSYTLKREL